MSEDKLSESTWDSLSSVFSEDDLDTAKKIIHKLGNTRADSTNPVSVPEINDWFRATLSESDLKRILGVLISSDAPVSGDLTMNTVYLDDEYFQEPGVPSDVEEKAKIPESKDSSDIDEDQRQTENEIQELKLKIVSKLLRKQVIGPNKKQIDTIINWFVADEQKEVKKSIEQLAADPDSPVEISDGENKIWLTNYEDSKAFLEQNSNQSSPYLI